MRIGPPYVQAKLDSCVSPFLKWARFGSDYWYPILSQDKQPQILRLAVLAQDDTKDGVRNLLGRFIADECVPRERRWP
jgi:hypothetical protein